MQTIAELLAQELGASPVHVQNVIDLLDQGNTIPFIARYRKELHGSMDDTALRKLEDRLTYLRNLEQRRQEVKSAIEGQEKLTPELAAAIDSARTLAEVEDLYRPYKQKRRTRATVAREKGLAPLAELLLAQRRDCPDPMQAAQGFIDPEKPPAARLCGSCCAVRGDCGAWPPGRRTPSTGCTTTLSSPFPSWQGIRSWPSTEAKRRASSPSRCCWIGRPASPPCAGRW